MAASDNVVRRRTPLRPSWLERIRAASSGVVGTARDVVDKGPIDTSPRTPWYPVEAELDVDETLFGEPPASTRLTGSASLPPDEREGGGFPPDLLRETSFWDEARPGTSSRVVVLIGDDAPVVRTLGSDDPLAGDVRDVHRWIEEEANASDVVVDLGGRPAGPVAFDAGFHLLLSQGADPAATFARFRTVPRTGSALAAVVERLRIEASDWEDDTVAEVAEALADGWEEERDPATVVAYITWFDAHHDGVRPDLRERVARLAERDASASFDGPWDDEVHRRAEALRAELA